MAFSTNLQQILAYLKAGHPVMPNLQAVQAVPQFSPPQLPAGPPATQQPTQGLQGTMPMTAPRIG